MPYLLSSLMAGFVGVLVVGKLGGGSPSTASGTEIIIPLLVILGGTALSRVVLGNGVINMIGGIVAAALYAICVQTVLSADLPGFIYGALAGLALLLVVPLSYFYYRGVPTLPSVKRLLNMSEATPDTNPDSMEPSNDNIKHADAQNEGHIGLANMAYLFGGLSLFASVIPLLGILISGLGFVLGLFGRNSARERIAIAGMVLCILGIILSVISWIYGG